MTLSLFDIIINIIEAILNVLFIHLSFIGFKKYKPLTFFIFVILEFSLITYYNTIYFSELYLLIAHLIILSLYGLKIKNTIISSFFSSIIFQIILLFSSTFALASHDVIYSLFSIPLSYINIVIISKLSYLLLGVGISNLLFRNSNISSKNKKYFFISLFLLITLYSSIFNSLSDIPHANWKVYFQLIILIIFTICICMLFKKATKDQYEKYQLYLLYKEQEVQNKNYEQLEKSINEISSLRHDMKHILNLIKYHNNRNNKDAIYDIINQQLDSISNIKEVISSGSQSLDYILYQNSNLIKEQNIQLVCNHFVINEKAIDEIDYFTILGNLFDNALENCKANPDKKIIIDRGVKNGNYYFKISNSIDAPILQTNPNLKTTKNNSKYHGIGINNIKEIIKKYNGDIFFDDDGVFFTCVMIIPNIDQEVSV